MIYAGVHPKLMGSLYRTTSKRFPFSIYYSLDEDIATVIAVLDSRQNPERIRAKLSGFDM